MYKWALLTHYNSIGIAPSKTIPKVKPSSRIRLPFLAHKVFAIHMQDAMNEFPGLQYCKTDLMADKGVIFCKYGRSSQALAAMETINTLGMVGYCYVIHRPNPQPPFHSIPTHTNSTHHSA